jgi:predicted DNA-binding transcriptional regulator YafY
MYSMLLGMGAEAEVLEPAPVRAELSKRARAAAERYEERGSKPSIQT